MSKEATRPLTRATWVALTCGKMDAFVTNLTGGCDDDSLHIPRSEAVIGLEY